ncbi:MAG: hypothetical protein FWE06_00220 [Oscillospiraceae bacterium]|nr:hypothetical protein [Oscillospiraceae bacterium]
MKKILIPAILCALFVLLLTACDNNGTTTEPNGETTAPTETIISAEPNGETTEPTITEPIDEEGLLTGERFTMEIADGWEISDLLPGIAALAAPHSASNINVIPENSQGFDLDDMLDATIPMLENLFSGFELMEREDDLEINGKEAAFIMYQSDFPGVEMTYQFFILANDMIFTVTYTRMDDTDFMDDVVTMLETFTVR